MTEGVYFEVPGPFGVKGSTVSFIDRRGVLRTKTDSTHGKTFAAAVRVAARAAGVARIPKGRGVSISVLYGFPRPKGTRRVYPCVRPDLDKLDRALLDALTGLAYDDDGQVIALSSHKLYGDTLRARIVIREEKDHDEIQIRTGLYRELEQRAAAPRGSGRPDMDRRRDSD